MFFWYIYLAIGFLSLVSGLLLSVFVKERYWKWGGLFLALGLGLPEVLTSMLYLGYI